MPKRINTLTLTDDEARLLLLATSEYANGLEFQIEREAQAKAYDSWLLAGRIAELLDPPGDA